MRIESRFRGPPASSNGGYACGLLAGLVPGVAEVTLRAPPPLDRELTALTTAAGAELRDGADLVAQAVPATITVEPPAPVSLEEAARASSDYPWRVGHPYPGCFVCGPERRRDDGLCIFPGAVAGRSVAAAPWTPHASLAAEDGLVRREIVWAALDCPSWFGRLCFGRFEGRVLLGRLTARVARRPRAGEPCVAMGWLLRTDGRKIHTASALHDASGELLAVAQATWIELKA